MVQISDALDDLLVISRLYGLDDAYIIAGGGNTSYKTDGQIIIKASGYALGTITLEEFVELDRKKVSEIMKRKFSQDPAQREEEIRDDLLACRIYPEKNQRASVETSLHEMIHYPYVVHTHPYIFNALLCSRRALEKTASLFGDRVLFVPYIDPGYTLAKKIQTEIGLFQKKHGIDPQIIFLQNHGVFVSAETIIEIKAIYAELSNIIQSEFISTYTLSPLPISSRLKDLAKYLPELIANLPPKEGGSPNYPSLLKVSAHNDSLIDQFYGDQASFAKVGYAFTPDFVVYCKAAPLFINYSGGNADFLEIVSSKLVEYVDHWGYLPKIMIFQDLGYTILDESEKAVSIVERMFQELMKISLNSDSFGGPQFLTLQQIAFIDHWEVENYRRQVVKE